MNNIADELNRDASELIRAARIPQTTSPFTPAGSNFATSVGKAASGIDSLNTSPLIITPFLLNAKAIIPGIRKRNTGSSFRYAPKMAPRRACFISLPERTRCTMYWSVHQYQKPMMEEPISAPSHGYCGSRLSRINCVMVSP